MSKKVLVLGLILIGCQCFASPELKVPLIVSSPVIDGKMDKNEWKDATCASGFISTAKEWALLQTSAYIAVNGQYLYFAFKCQSLGIDKIKAGKYEKDSTKIFGDESVELFLAPEVSSNTYYQIAFNTVGSFYTAKCGDKRDVGWEPKLELATSQSAKNWIAEGRLPLASIGTKNIIGTKWKLNFCRNSHISRRQSSSWTGQSHFNDKTLMGSAEITKNAFVDYSLENINIPSGFQLRLRNHQLEKVECEIVAVYSKKEYIYSYSLDSKKAENISSGPLLSAKGRNVTLKISGNNFKYEKSALLPYYKKFSIIPEFYYFAPPVNKVEVKVDNKIQNTSVIKISLYSSNEKKPLQQMKLKASETDFSIDLKGFPCGRYVLSAQLFDESGKQVAEDDKLIFIKKKPELSALPAKQNIRIENSMLFMNDKPFFPFMTSSNYKIGPNIPACFNVKYGNIGVKNNSFVRGRSGVPVRLRRKPFILYELPDEETVKKRISDFIAKTSNRKTLYRSIQYEAQIPLFRLTKGGLKPLSASAEYFKIYNFIKKISPETLTSIQTDKLGKVNEFANCADIIEVASYSSSYARNPINSISRDIKQVGDKPLVWWIGASIPSPNARTAENIRAASYLAIMNGVNGIIYHNGHGGVPVSKTRLWSVFPELSHEIEFLYPIIASGKKAADKNVRVKPSEIEFVMRRHEGAIFIIAVNASPVTLQGTFSLSPALHNGKVKVLFENREIEFKNGKIQDNFTPYETHVYIIK
jgi:Carbohydrate family 9 binding domain-like